MPKVGAKKPTKPRKQKAGEWSKGYEAGRESVIEIFRAACDGKIQLEAFWQIMGIDPAATRIQIVFANAQAAQPRSSQVLLCKIGQLDGQGQALTAEKIVTIAEAYNNRGIAVELNTNGELWTKGEA